MDPKIHSTPRVYNAHFRLLRCGFTLMGFSLSKIRDRLSIEPQEIVQSAIQFWGVVHEHGLGHASFRLGICREPC
jgi:hypothetical protein